MKKLLKTIDALGGARRIQTEDGAFVATFSNCEAGKLAFETFKEGVAAGKQFNLFDGDTGEFLAGDLSV